MSAQLIPVSKVKSGVSLKETGPSKPVMRRSVLYGFLGTLRAFRGRYADEASIRSGDPVLIILTFFFSRGKKCLGTGEVGLNDGYGILEACREPVFATLRIERKILKPLIMKAQRK